MVMRMTRIILEAHHIMEFLDYSQMARSPAKELYNPIILRACLRVASGRPSACAI